MQFALVRMARTSQLGNQRKREKRLTLSHTMLSSTAATFLVPSAHLAAGLLCPTEAAFKEQRKRLAATVLRLVPVSFTEHYAFSERNGR